jgi:hypothetical protein
VQVYVVRKWLLRGRSFVCWNVTPVSLWLMCNVHFVQSIRPTIATWPRWPKDTDHCNSEEFRCTHVDACVETTWISYRCVPCHPSCTHRTFLVIKKTFSVFLWLWKVRLSFVKTSEFCGGGDFNTPPRYTAVYEWINNIIEETFICCNPLLYLNLWSVTVR